MGAGKGDPHDFLVLFKVNFETLDFIEAGVADRGLVRVRVVFVGDFTAHVGF